MKKWTPIIVCLILIGLTASLFQAPPALAAEDSDVPTAEGLIYEYWAGTTYGDAVTGWVRYDPAEGAPHPYNQLEENEWFIPEINRDDPMPYGSRTQVRSGKLIHEWWRPENSSWVVYDPNSGNIHPDNSVNGTLSDGCPEYARDWVQPYWASTRTRDPNPPETTPVDSGDEDPFGTLITDNLGLVDTWWGSIYNWFVHLIGRDDLHGQGGSASDTYNDYIDPDKQP